MVNREAAAAYNFVNNPVQYMPRMGNQRIFRIEVPSVNMQTLATEHGIIRIRLPASLAQSLQNAQNIARMQQPPVNGQTQQ